MATLCRFAEGLRGATASMWGQANLRALRGRRRTAEKTDFLFLVHSGNGCDEQICPHWHVWSRGWKGVTLGQIRECDSTQWRESILIVTCCAVWKCKQIYPCRGLRWVIQGLSSQVYKIESSLPCHRSPWMMGKRSQGDHGWPPRGRVPWC